MLGELTVPEIDDLLRSEVVARIGCHADGRTYVVPITYVFVGDAIIGHSTDGMKIRMMRRNPEVCVEVDRVKGLADWRSVIAWGQYEELTGEAGVRAMEQLVTHLAPRMPSETAVPAHGRHPDHSATAQSAVVFRIHLTQKTGRFERRS